MQDRVDVGQETGKQLRAAFRAATPGQWLVIEEEAIGQDDAREFIVVLVSSCGRFAHQVATFDGERATEDARLVAQLVEFGRAVWG